MTDLILSDDYYELLADLKNKVILAKNKAAISINKELILLYHSIGVKILESQDEKGWGAKVIEQLAKDLKSEFPDMKSFSIRNLRYMRRLAEEYQDIIIVQQLVAQLPWGHNILLMEKFDNKDIRRFYMDKAIENGWSRNFMLSQIENKLHKRIGKAVTNFNAKLPAKQAELAINVLKDPYIFDFLSIGRDAHERDIERELIKHVEKFLLELGAGFAFVGRQYHLEIGDQDFYIDLLFYHLKLRCFVVIDLKDTDFKPEYAGKMNFYLSCVDDLIRHESDQPSIGLILCREKNNILAEYALRDMAKPIGLAEYRIMENLPKNLQTSLPTIEEIEKKLSEMIKEE